MEKIHQKDRGKSVQSDLKIIEQGVDFKLERYKYILQEIRSLNESLHKYLTLFQTLATAIIGGGISIFVSWRSLKINPDAAKVGIQGLLGLLLLLTIFLIVSLIANAISWFDYRREEVELLEKVAQPNFRKPPTIRNFWRWSETYVLIFMVVLVTVVTFYVELVIIPSIH